MRKFCVIADKSSSCTVTRTWFDEQHKAEMHAHSLIRNQICSNPSKSVTLFVVEVKAVCATLQPQVSTYSPEEFFQSRGDLHQC
jgi:hypothetical protein